MDISEAVIRIVLDTTRQPRKGEVEGKDYHFVAKETFEREIKERKFIEHAVFGGNMYGTSIQAVRNVFDSGKICILDVDRQGVQSIKKTDMNAHFLFIEPPSVEILEQRLRGRGTETDDSLAKRMMSVKEDLEYAKQSGSYDMVIVNDDLERAYGEFRAFIVSKYPSVAK